MKIKKLTANGFNAGTRYSMFGRKNNAGETQDIINAEFTATTRNLRILYFKDSEENELNVVISADEAENGFNIIEHNPAEQEWYILLNCNHLIHGFESKTEADEYFKTNKELLRQLNHGSMDTVEVKNGVEVGDIVLNIFFANESGFDVKWIKKTEELENHVLLANSAC